ncbi:ATP-binding protein [Neolewinella aurantiaca]|uniref:ATP-binding protein n=1 Tax=Neolewinella aurantiaca TaxID=2602767 RepID=A0A5C7FHY5_9BACT|nr:ATP-binding protein [Neolewinella aurantiaca]TXF90834.1 ATP-binding protein [Neolewinella aurantiaca]
MSLEKYFDEIDLEELKRFVKDKREEDVHLEFKRAVHLNFNDKNRNSDKKNLSKCLSGFANSDGGILIWGIEAAMNNGVDCATRLKPINELKKFSNRLNSLEGQSVVPTIEGVRHEIILLESEGDRGFIKTFVPKSRVAPHMALYSDKHYYKRSGDSFYIAEHYDITDMFARDKSPMLDIKISDMSWRRIGAEQNEFRAEIVFAVENKGKAIAKFPYLFVQMNLAYKFAEHGLNGNGHIGLKKINGTRCYREYSGGNDIVIYPNVLLEVDRIRGEFSFLRMEDFCDIILEFELIAENMELVKRKITISKEDMLKPEHCSVR